MSGHAPKKTGLAQIDRHNTVSERWGLAKMVLVPSGDLLVQRLISQSMPVVEECSIMEGS